jgi:hypothetical protein
MRAISGRLRRAATSVSRCNPPPRHPLKGWHDPGTSDGLLINGSIWRGRKPVAPPAGIRRRPAGDDDATRWVRRVTDSRRRTIDSRSRRPGASSSPSSMSRHDLPNLVPEEVLIQAPPSSWPVWREMGEPCRRVGARSPLAAFLRGRRRHGRQRPDPPGWERADPRSEQPFRRLRVTPGAARQSVSGAPQEGRLAGPRITDDDEARFDSASCRDWRVLAPRFRATALCDRAPSPRRGPRQARSWPSWSSAR